MLVGGDRAFLDALTGNQDDPRAGREGIPVAFRITQALRGCRIEHFRSQRLQEALGLGDLQAACIHRHQEIGGAVFTFGLEAFDELVGIGIHHPDLDPRSLGEQRVDLLVDAVVAVGIYVEHVLRNGRARAHHEHGQRDGKRACEFEQL